VGAGARAREFANMRSRVLPRLSASLCEVCVCVAWAAGAACLKVVSE
jgi:hypothetical protein